MHAWQRVVLQLIVILCMHSYHQLLCKESDQPLYLAHADTDMGEAMVVATIWLSRCSMLLSRHVVQA
jgi:hypothetical protein